MIGNGILTKEQVIDNLSILIEKENDTEPGG
jgi:hypothetical protein